jgi:serine/threonine protein kinase
VKFLQEAAIITQFNHPNVCKAFGVVTEGDPVMLVLELLPNGCLYDYLKSARSGKVSVATTDQIRMALDIASALKYLHSMSFIHRGISLC